MVTMVLSDSGAAWGKVIVVQLALVAALFALYKAYLPREEREQAASQVAERERRIQAFARTMIVEDPMRPAAGVGADGEQLSHAQKLLQEDSVDEVKQALGPSQSEYPDFRGGQHLAWTGTSHKLEASFNKGALYNLRYTDLRTGHGVTVFESSLYWQSY